MKILIIEDEEFIRFTLQEILQLNGHEVVTAPDGPAGVEAARHSPDLILCDIGLPGLDGYGVLRAVQQLPACRDVPFIFLTARAEREDQRRGMALGADDYLTKPFTERELLEAIAARVRRQRPLRERIEQLVAEHDREIGADWSHELMTPLNGVFGALQLIEVEADTIKPDELRELLGLIRGSAERQLRFSRKLLLYFDLQRRQDRSPAGRCDAAPAVTSAVARIGAAEGRGMDIAVGLEPGQVRGDAAYLAEAVGELVENACHFSPAGRPIRVKGFLRGDRYRIEVTDRGEGLSPEQCAALRPFVQLGRGRQEQQGLGLGLAIARGVAELAGGRLELGPAPGGGLLAALDLPVA